MPGSLDHVSLLCAGRSPAELPGCLNDALGGSFNTRGVDEVWIRFLAVLVAAMASCGHLMSLQGSVHSLQSLLVLLCFFEFPEMALAQAMIRTTITVMRVVRGRERLSVRFFVSSCLGMNATQGSSPNRVFPLVSLRYEQVERVPQKFGILSIGRLGLLIAFLVQYAGTISIWVRGVFQIQDRGFWFWYIDLRIFRIALGGLAATLTSTLIVACGSEWRLLDLLDKDMQPLSLQRTDTSSTLCPGESDELLRIHSEKQEAESHEPRFRLDGLASLCTMWKMLKNIATLYARSKALNASFSQVLDNVFPAIRQFDLELGIILYRVWVYCITIYVLRYRFSSGCPPILHFLSETTSTFDWTQGCPDRMSIWDATTFSMTLRWREHTRYWRALQISNALFNIGVSRILVKWSFAMLARMYEKIWKPLPAKVRSFEQWALSGRSVISFPFLIMLFACFPVAVVNLIENKSWIKKAQSVLEHPGIGVTDRLAMSVLMWKDPWQDNLYII